MLPKPLFKEWSRVCVLLVVIKHIGYNQCLFSTSFCTLVFCEINVVLFQLWSGLFLQSLFTLSQGWSLLEWILYIQTILQEYGQGAGNTTQVWIFKLHPKKFPRFDSAQFLLQLQKKVKSVLEPSGPLSRSLSQFPQCEATRSITTLPWMAC